MRKSRWIPRNPRMRKAPRFRTVATVVAVAITFPAMAAATVSPGQYGPTTPNSANAPTGTHLKSGSTLPYCIVDESFDVTCGTDPAATGSFTLAGVGNTDVRADLVANYSATVVCINNGTNPSDSQHQGNFQKSSPSGILKPKNGNVTVPSRMVSPPTEQQFLSQQTCPNPNWTPTIPGGITLHDFTYTVTFVDSQGDPAFPGPYIEISATDP
jgi:hypothetical protein